MSITTKYAFLSSVANLIDFDLNFGSVTLDGQEVKYVGSTSADIVFLHPGISVNFSNAGGGVDKLYLSGSFSDYTFDIVGSSASISRTGTDSFGVVKTEKAIVGSGDSLVFADGYLSTAQVISYATAVVAARNASTTPPVLPTLNTADTTLAPVLPATLNATVKASAIVQTGVTFSEMNPGVVLKVVGGTGVDAVYVKAGTQVNASGLGGGIDLIYFTGNWADYTSKYISGTSVVFERTVNGNQEKITFGIGDKAIFADGSALTAAIKTIVSLTPSTGTAATPKPLAWNGGDVTPGLHDIQSITTINDIRISGYYKAGETITFSVNVKEDVTIVGVPRLKVVVGSTEHELDYVSAGSTARRLLFQYVVLSTDSDWDGVAIPNGAAAFALDAGVSIKYANNTDLPLEHDPVTGFARAKIDNFTPTGTPSITSVTDDVGTPQTIAHGGTSNDSKPTVRVSLVGTGARADDRIQLYNDQAVLGVAVLLTQQNIDDAYVDVTTTALSEATYAFKVKLITPADIASALSSTAYSITLDLTAPIVSITSVTDDTTPQAGTVSSGGYSNDTQLAVRVNLLGSTLAINETVQLFNGSTAISAAMTVTAQHNIDRYIDITTSLLTHGTTYAITVRVTDVWGNSRDSATHTVTIDTAAPAAVTMALQQDTGSSATDNITRNGNITISGLEVGATWEYSTDGGSSWTTGNGGASATTSMGNLNLLASSYTAGSVMVRQTDQAGNVGTTATLGNTALVPHRLQGMSGNSLSDNAPQLVAMVDGGYVLTWYGDTNDGKGYAVFVQRFDVNNVAVGSLKRLQGTATGVYLVQDPQITALSDGSYVVTWQGHISDSQGYDTYAQRFTAGNVLSGSTQRLHGMAGLLDDTAPQVSALANGGYALAWSGATSDSQGTDIFIQVVGSTNATVGNLHRLHSTSGNFADAQAQITALTGGGFVVTWRGYKTSGTWDRDIVVQQFDSTDNALGSAQKIGDLGSYNEDDVPQVLALADGGYVVVWQGYVPADGASNILVQRFDSNGVAAGAQLGLRGMSSSYLYDYAPQAAALAGGSYVIAWSGDTSDSQNYDVFVQLVDSNNSAVGSPQRLQGISGYYSDSVPQITALSGGGYVVVWQGTTSDAGTDIFLQQFSNNGQPAGNMQRLEGISGAALADTAPQLTALADGGYVVTWQGATNDSQLTDIFTQRFNSQGNHTQTLTVDTMAPGFSSGSVNGNMVTLIYGEALDTGALSDASRFTVTSGGNAIAVTSVSASGSTLTLNLASRVGYQKAVSVAYTDPTTSDDANAVQDKAGNDAVSLAATPINNYSQFVAPTMSLLVDTGSSSSDGITSNGQVVVSGLEAGATWQYSTDGGSTWAAGSGSSFTLTDGTYSLEIKQTLNGYTTSIGYNSSTVTVDKVAPTSIIKGFDKYGYTFEGITENYLTDIVGASMTHTAGYYSAALEGTTEAYATVTFNIGGQSHTAVADYSGYWYYRLTDTDFSNVGYGAEAITVTGATDRAGNASSVQVTHDVTFNAVADTMSHAESGYGSDYVDALIYGGAGWKGTTITYSFAPGSGATAWTVAEKQAFANACHTYENICNLHFVEGIYYADDYSATNITVNKVPGSTWTNQPGWVTLADFNLPTDGFNSYNGALQGRFNYEYSAWNNLTPGSLGFNTIIHELGHGLGMAHPFDGTPTFPGVTYGDLTDMGDYNLNQGAWSVMTYSHDWANSPTSSNDWGFGKTPMTFDVSAMQTMYGANISYRTGDNVYQLPKTEATGTGWECIWDAGGTDTISNAGANTGSYINLNAYPKTGGLVSEGYVSYNYASLGTTTPSLNTAGGFTIADGVIIENAIGGNGADIITSNAASNTLTGNSGADAFVFNTALGATNIDTITDFTTTQSDVLQLDDAIFRALAGLTAVTADKFCSGAGITAAADPNDFLIYNTTTGALYYDRDGSASIYAPLEFALLLNKPQNFNNTYFVVI
jgi:hypothetical protein